MVQGLESSWPCSISQFDDDVSRDDVTITFRAIPPKIPWAGARVANPQDWNRMFGAQEGDGPSSTCEGREGGSLAKLFPTPSFQMMSPLTHQLRSPDKYDPLILTEKLAPEAHCFPLSKR